MKLTNRQIEAAYWVLNKKIREEEAKRKTEIVKNFKITHKDIYNKLLKFKKIHKEMDNLRQELTQLVDPNNYIFYSVKAGTDTEWTINKIAEINSEIRCVSLKEFGNELIVSGDTDLSTAIEKAFKEITNTK